MLDVTWDRGEAQPAQCQNVGFAVLFLMQLTVVLFLAIYYVTRVAKGAAGFDFDDDDDNAPDENPNVGVIYFNMLAATVAIGWSTLAMFLFGTFAEHVIQASLIISPVVILATSIAGTIASNNAGYAVAGGLSFLLSVWYTFCVWRRVPFAAANLTTAMAAIRANYGITVVSFASLIKTMVFTLLWAIAMMGLFISIDHSCKGGSEENSQTDDDEDCSDGNSYALWIFCLFLLSLYWTLQVIQNLLRTTVAGVVSFCPGSLFKPSTMSLFKTSSHLQILINRLERGGLHQVKQCHVVRQQFRIRYIDHILTHLELYVLDLSLLPSYKSFSFWCEWRETRIGINETTPVELSVSVW